MILYHQNVKDDIYSKIRRTDAKLEKACKEVADLKQKADTLVQQAK